MEENKDFNKIIITDTLSEIASPKMDGYLAHALCLDGKGEFDFNGRHFTLGKKDLMIVRKGELMSNMKFSADFKVKVIYIDKGFIEPCTPQSN